VKNTITKSVAKLSNLLLLVLFYTTIIAIKSFVHNEIDLRSRTKKSHLNNSAN